MKNLPLITLIVIAVLLYFLPLVDSNHSTNVVGDSALYMSYLLSVFEDGDLELGDDYLEIDPNIATGQPNHLRKTDKGYTIATFPPGPAILWSPFFLAAKGYCAIKGEDDREKQLQSFKKACHLGTTVYTVAALILLYFFLMNYFSPWVSSIASLATFVLTPLMGYGYYMRVDSHAVGFFAVCLFLWYCNRNREDRSLKQWAVLGAIAGLVFMVRWTDLLVGVWLLTEQIPLLWSSLKEKKFPTRKLLEYGVFILAFLVVIIPQIIVHETIFGFGKGPMNYGANFVKWDRPEVMSILFSTRNGLISWHPMILAGFAGLLLLFRTKPARAASTLLVLAVAVYVNSTIGDWWAGHAFGMRRMISYLPFIGLGFAALLEARKSRWYQGSVMAVMLFFAIWNMAMLNAFLHGRIPHQVSAAAANPLNMERTWINAFARPLSLPAELYSSFVLPGVPPREAEWITSRQLMFCEDSLGGEVRADYPSFQGGFGPVRKDARGSYRELKQKGRLYVYRLANNGSGYFTFNADVWNSKLKRTRIPVLKVTLNGVEEDLVTIPRQGTHNFNTFVRTQLHNWKHGINYIDVELFHIRKGQAKQYLTRLLHKGRVELEEPGGNFNLRVRSVKFQRKPFIKNSQLPDQR